MFAILQLRTNAPTLFDFRARPAVVSTVSADEQLYRVCAAPLLEQSVS